MNKILESLNGNSAPRLDEEELNQKFGSSVSWTEMKSGSRTSFTTCRFKMSGDQLKAVVSIQLILFSSAFIGAGLFMLYQSYANNAFDNFDTKESLWMLIGSGMFLFGGLFFLSSGLRKIIFDKRNYKFTVDKGGVFRSGIEEGSLSSIKAIQVLAVRYYSKGKSHINLELNLVLNNDDRIHVIKHGGISSLESDIKLLSEFLDVPVWRRT